MKVIGAADIASKVTSRLLLRMFLSLFNLHWRSPLPPKLCPNHLSLISNLHWRSPLPQCSNEQTGNRSACLTWQQSAIRTWKPLQVHHAVKHLQSNKSQLKIGNPMKIIRCTKQPVRSNPTFKQLDDLMSAWTAHPKADFYNRYNESAPCEINEASSRARFLAAIRTGQTQLKPEGGAPAETWTCACSQTNNLEQMSCAYCARRR